MPFFFWKVIIWSALCHLAASAADMAPKLPNGSQKSSASSAASGKKALKKDTGSTKLSKSAGGWHTEGKFTRWKGVLPVGHCLPCDQTTADIDRDCPYGHDDLLYWVQSRIAAKHNNGNPIPAGKECYACMLFNSQALLQFHQG